EVRGSEELDNAFQAAVKGRAEALIVVTTGLMGSHRSPIVNLAVKTRLPAMYSNTYFVREGGLMGYAADIPARARRVAIYVDKILKGATPGALPVEAPTKFGLVINLNTAKQIGLTIPQSVLYQADKVIK